MKKLAHPTEKEELKIYRNLLINLHTAAWTCNTKKFQELMERIGRYSYARTNTNGFPEEEEERMKQTLLDPDK
jgi:hypothetical protein